MNEIIKYYVNLFSSATKSLKKQAVFLEKPWAFIDEDGEIQKLIFKKDKGLVISKNGQVVMGKWDYFPEARALLIDRVTDKLLLGEQFVDENVLILKKDGTQNQFFALANENTLPTYNIPKYLNKIKKVQLNMGEVVLLCGKKLQVEDAKEIPGLYYLEGRKAELIDESFNPLPITDGVFMSKTKKFTYYIENGLVKKAYKNRIEKTIDGVEFEIEDGLNNRINKRVTINGIPASTDRIISYYNEIYKLKESVIFNIMFIKIHFLSNGYAIKLEQKEENKISKGDLVIHSEPISPIPDGKYKIKGSLFKWIEIKGCVVV